MLSTLNYVIAMNCWDVSGEPLEKIVAIYENVTTKMMLACYYTGSRYLNLKKPYRDK